MMSPLGTEEKPWLIPENLDPGKAAGYNMQFARR